LKKISSMYVNKTLLTMPENVIIRKMCMGDKVLDSFETLKKRYSDEDYVKSAAARRDALDCEKITFGKNLSPQKRYILLLLKDAHASFYTGNYPAVIALCGMMLESVLSMKAQALFALVKYLEYTRRPNGQVFTVKSEEELEDLQFNDLIGVCFKYHYISNEMFQDLRNIHKIRNITVHDKMPYFKRVDDDYVLELPGSKFPVALARERVKPLVRDTASLSSFYCLTRTRNILHAVIESID